MNKLILLTLALCAGAAAYSQEDSSRQSTTDTVKAGNFIIIKKKKTNPEGGADRSTQVKFDVKKRYSNRNSNISTNWFIFDLGFANWRDKTDYNGPAFTGQRSPDGYIRNIPYTGKSDNPVNKSSFNLRNAKSSNVNIWLFMQKWHMIKKVVNLKYGLGLEMYNYRFDSDISFRNTPQPYAFMDSVSFTKNKLYAGYITVPLLLNFTPSGSSRRGITFSAGVSAGYLVGSRNKQISANRGKQKTKGNLEMEPWRLAAIGEIGLGPVRLYGSYSLNSLQKKAETGLEQYPYAVGVRFSTF
ncbi:outer membrane beta-barrel protein [Filimonas effusa]|uniref:Outer membrane protein beta-barrel domain-containing protein n=1 Tax=Filimonas effusa TaxID=2508721 RepID=A0A4Q1D4P4_9BACT|nr:outer membrane beta-barrel protein [Filimonas effusa]RXK83452.1 hypothetical protein ESB13_15260 [Filimonas effusa]